MTTATEPRTINAPESEARAFSHDAVRLTSTTATAYRAGSPLVSRVYTIRDADRLNGFAEWLGFILARTKR